MVLEEGSGEGATVDGEELALLQQMGLPTSFGTSKVRSRVKSGRSHRTSSY